MTANKQLAAHFEAYADWRRRLSAAISSCHGWLTDEDLVDAQVDLQFQRLLERLHQDKLVVAFVAEFSRGKSELINAIFFADFGQRLLPSSAGRTTMCPTELLFDASRPPSIRLLPIETRIRDAPVAEFKNYADEWITMMLDLSSPERIAEVLSQVSQTKRVPIDLAQRYGLYDANDIASTVGLGQDGTVEIPCWRHAVVNFPHPLLKQGLVVLDTPGLNAIGTEPELTLNLLPNAHAILFILAADTGVTKTDIEVWHNHLAGKDAASRHGRLVILNKIDGLWDELKTDAVVNAEIAKQTQSSASLLCLSQDQVFPISAQKGLLAKVNGDDTLLAKSRLPQLERALSRELIPAKREIVGAATQAEVHAIARGIRAILDARKNGVVEQLHEMQSLRGKNDDVISHMMDRIRAEKDSFDRSLQRFTALRTVFAQQTNKLVTVMGMEVFRNNAVETRKRIQESPFTKGVRAAMTAFFTKIYDGLDQSAHQTTEIHEMMQAMYRRFAGEHGLEPYNPPPFSMLKYQKEVQRLERAYKVHFNTLWNMVSTEKFTLQRKFFETIASRIKHVYHIANRDVESWLKAVMAPLETQVREHQIQLRRRLDSIKRIHRASDELEERIEELEQAESVIDSQLRALQTQLLAVEIIVEAPDSLPMAANA